MKIKQKIGLVAAATGILLATQGCSDNYDTTLVPVKSKIELMVDGHASGFSVDYGAEPNSDIVVSVESNTLWKVEIECTGGWCTADKITGRGNESFTLSILENINKERNAFVNVYVVDENGDPLAATDGQVTSIQMTLKQAVSDVRLSPASFEPFKAQGNDWTRMQIVSNVAWTLDVTYEGENPTQFVNITPSEGDMTLSEDGKYSGDGNASFELTIADNRTAAERRAFINLRSAVDSYSVEIRQLKSEYTFDVSPTETQYVNSDGTQIAYGVLSLSGWKVSTAADWISFSKASGAGSPNREETIATVFPNMTGAVRTAEIHFNPDNESYQGLSVTVVQAANEMVAEPAVSIPWLLDGYGQTSATVCFNFYSPYMPIVEAGLLWRKESDTEWNETTQSVADSMQATVAFELSNLNGATKYVACGFVKTADGLIKYGSISIPFTTAGQYPENGDNPPVTN